MTLAEIAYTAYVGQTPGYRWPVFADLSPQMQTMWSVVANAVKEGKEIRIISPHYPTLGDQDAIVRARRLEYLMVDAKKPDEPERTIFGIEVSSLSREELLAAFYKVARENDLIRSERDGNRHRH